MITMLKIAELYPHKDNPRKELGDLTELSESIKSNGIFQNLTVVPRAEGGYTVIIGHRRMAAAKLAGLEELPCAIVEMDERTQLSTMLLENMQRSDLTTFEQAQGFQMMFNLGMSAEEISDKSGFSVSTVKKRLKIATLPADELKNSMEHGGTIEQYISIAEIKNEEMQKELLEAVGTNNFEWKFNVAKRAQIQKEMLPLIRKELEYAKEVPSGSNYGSKYHVVKSRNVVDYKQGDFSNPSDGKDYFYEIGNGWVYLLTLKPKEKKPSKSKEEIAADRLRQQLEEVRKSAFELRKAFVFGFNAHEKYKNVIFENLVKAVLKSETKYYAKDYELLNLILGSEGLGRSPECVDNVLSEQGSKIAVKLIQYLYSDNKNAGYYSAGYKSKAPEWTENKKLDNLYSFLCELGYQMSDDEIALQNGTHELFGGENDR